jgi:ATP-binding cassette, subfamily B, bacterial HlyB/CyaB
VLIFDEAVTGLDALTAEQFARTINKLRGKVTIVFITHQIPRGLQVDDVFQLGTHAVGMQSVAPAAQGQAA